MVGHLRDKSYLRESKEANSVEEVKSPRHLRRREKRRNERSTSMKHKNEEFDQKRESRKMNK